MITRAILFFILSLAVCMPDFTAAQIGRRSHKKETAASDYEWQIDDEEEEIEEEKIEEKEIRRDRATSRKEKRRNRREKRREEREKQETREDAPEENIRPPLSGKADIERHLQARVKMLKRYHQEQVMHGKRAHREWVKFWDTMYADRKLFDVRIARQRLNLFESLASLDPASHKQIIVDFERLQATQVESFEANLQQRMNDYLAQRIEDLKEFTAEQERKREEFNRNFMGSWQDQISGGGEERSTRSKKKKKRRRKRR